MLTGPDYCMDDLIKKTNIESIENIEFESTIISIKSHHK